MGLLLFHFSPKLFLCDLGFDKTGSMTRTKGKRSLRMERIESCTQLEVVTETGRPMLRFVPFYGRDFMPARTGNKNDASICHVRHMADKRLCGMS